jgi:hypothetical protein
MADAQPTAETQEVSLADQLRALREQQKAGGEDSPAAPENGQEAASTTGEKPADKPPWGDDFNAERAWNTIQSQREENRELKAREIQREREKMTELERTKAELAEARHANETLQISQLRNSVALSKGLPASAIKFLEGKDQREVEASADELLRLMGGASKAPPDYGNGARPPAGGDTSDFNSMLRRSAGRPA